MRIGTAKGSIQRRLPHGVIVTSFLPLPALTGWVFDEVSLTGRKKRYFVHSTISLRILFLVALFRVRAFLLHLLKRLCHVFDLIPNIKAYVDRGALRTRHRDTIAGPRIDLDLF